MSQFFKVLFRHSPKEDGKYRQMETVYHLHGDTDGYDNHRCSLTEDGNYFCPGCKQNFSKEEINRYPYRDLPHNKSYWLESRRSGQHLPHNEKDVFWTHMHPQDDIHKKKVGEVDFSGIFASCQACDNILNLHTWQESHPDKKQLVFPGIVMENISVSIWKELKIFLEENVEIWLQDKDEKFFFLSNQLQLLPAENQEGILVCGERLFLDDDDRKCLLFQVDEINQSLIDEHLKEKIPPTEDFHLEIKMADEASKIPLKPESRRRSTKELSSGELAGLQTPPEREQSQEIIVIVDGEHAETHKIPRHYEVNLDEATPLPEDAHPLLIPDLADQKTADSCDGFAPSELAITEQPVADVNLAETPDPLENANADIDENAMTAESGMLGNQLPDFTSVEDDWFSTGEAEVDQKKILKEHAKTQAWLDKLGKAPTAVPRGRTLIGVPNMSLTEASTAAVPTITNVADSRDGFAPPELAMTEQPVTDVEHTDTAETEAAPTTTASDDTLAKLEAAEAALANANEVISQLLEQSRPVSGTIDTGTDVANEPTMALAEAPTAAVSTITNVTDSRDGFAPSELAMTDEPRTNVENTDDGAGEPTPASHHGVSRLCWECQRSLPADQACSEHEVSCPDCGLANSKKESTCRRCQHVLCSPEPDMTESANTGTTDAPSPEPIPASGGCGSAFTKKTEKPTTTPHPELKNVLTKIGLAVGMVGILVFGPMFFSWMINYFQSEDQKADLRAAEKRRMELSSQISKLRVEADLIRFDLLETTRDLNRVRNDISTVQTEQQRLAERQSELDNRLSNALSWEADLHAYFVKEKNLFGQYLAELAKNLRDEQKAWQRQERERSEQRYAELVKQFKSLATTQPRETPVVAPPKSLFGGKPEQEKPETTVLVEPAKSFLKEFLTPLIRESAKLAKKYRDHKKAPPTLVVDKTPPAAPPKNPTNITPPAVDKYPKPKNPQKLAEKSPKKPQKIEKSPTFEAKDLVHVWTGPTYF